MERADAEDQRTVGLEGVALRRPEQEVGGGDGRDYGEAPEDGPSRPLAVARPRRQRPRAEPGRDAPS
ncbi:MAG TPA: hypothetical protein VGP82_07870 [Ktedonobacterales bacterium]|nr:hypothetical protein [Ktedonobacterales bacterium]